MLDFLRFESLIAQDVLAVFYIACALALPFVCWAWLAWMVRRYAVLLRFYRSARRSLLVSLFVWIVQRLNFFQKKIDQQLSWEALSTAQKLKFMAVFVAIVLLSELFLRLTFEYLIAFMQMHEWLGEMSRQGAAALGQTLHSLELASRA